MRNFIPQHKHHFSPLNVTCHSYLEHRASLNARVLATTKKQADVNAMFIEINRFAIRLFRFCILILTRTDSQRNHGQQRGYRQLQR